MAQKLCLGFYIFCLERYRFKAFFIAVFTAVNQGTGHGCAMGVPSFVKEAPH
ncbi:hypothetical protein HLY09_18565 [Enterocloster bolteae]|uniref:hypothetical protein n=1 Tax=Enterocloster bolteae TaxID=208479 RepID=UPI00039D36B0|nr:hypothetical protein [Enterocloster bolteae]QJU21251.1 hypothetical protein HLY09_18565 [Enterocloster bolteae]